MSSPAAPNEFEVLLSALSADLAALRADVTELKRSHRPMPPAPRGHEALLTVNLASVLPRVPPRAP